LTTTDWGGLIAIIADLERDVPPQIAHKRFSAICCRRKISRNSRSVFRSAPPESPTTPAHLAEGSRNCIETLGSIETKIEALADQRAPPPFGPVVTTPAPDVETKLRGKPPATAGRRRYHPVTTDYDESAHACRYQMANSLT
jgi:hypothetical protein